MKGVVSGRDQAPVVRASGPVRRSQALDDHRAFPVRRAGGGQDRGVGGDVGGNAEAAAPLPRLGDDFLEPVERLAHQQADAVDELVKRGAGQELGAAQALEIALDQRTPAADDRAPDALAGQRQNLLRRLGGGHEGHAQQSDHLAVPPDVGVRTAAVKMQEVRVLEQFDQGRVVEIAVIKAVEVGDVVVAKSGDGGQHQLQRQPVPGHQLRGGGPPPGAQDGRRHRRDHGRCQGWRWRAGTKKQAAPVARRRLHRSGYGSLFDLWSASATGGYSSFTFHTMMLRLSHYLNSSITARVMAINF